MTSSLLSQRVTFFILFSLAILVAWTSPGFDDEFHNIRWALEAISAGSQQLYYDIASSDPAHPMGSYIISYVLYSFIPDWSIVRTIKTIIVSAIIYFSLAKLFPEINKGRKFDWIALCIFTPSFLMWATGLRWFGEFSAALTLSISLNAIINYKHRYFTPVLALTLSAMCAFSYLSILYVPIILIYHLINITQASKKYSYLDYASIAFIALVYAYSLIEPIAYNTSGASDQTSNLFSSLRGVAQGLLINPGFFPVSIMGAFTFFFTLMLVAMPIIPKIGYHLRSSLFILFTLLIATTVLSGLGAKYRNISPMIPLLFCYILNSGMLLLKGNDVLYRIFQALAVIFVTTNILGSINVLRHADTAKGSWNIPVAQVLHFIDGSNDSCNSSALFVWDPVLTFHLWENGAHVFNLSDDRGSPSHSDIDATDFDCFFMIETTSGSFKDHTFFSIADSLAGEVVAQYTLDRYADVKRSLSGQTFPSHYVIIRSLSQSDLSTIPQYFEPSSPYSEMNVDLVHDPSDQARRLAARVLTSAAGSHAAP